MIKLDLLYAHTDDMGETVGYFYGTPIREFFEKSARLREEEENSRITRRSMATRSKS